MNSKLLQSRAAWWSLIAFVLMLFRMTAVMAGFDKLNAFLLSLAGALLLGFVFRSRFKREALPQLQENLVVTDLVVIVGLILGISALPLVLSVWWYLFDRK